MCAKCSFGVQGLISQELPTWEKEHKEKSEKEKMNKKEV